MPNYVCHHCLRVFWTPFRAEADGRLKTSCPNCKTGEFFAEVGPQTEPDRYAVGYGDGYGEGKEVGYANGFSDGVKYGRKPNWYEIQISGNPQEPGDYLVFDIDYEVQRATFSHIEGWICSIDDIEPTHWMPLPEAPTTETPKELK